MLYQQSLVSQFVVPKFSQLNNRAVSYQCSEFFSSDEQKFNKKSQLSIASVGSGEEKYAFFALKKSKKKKYSLEALPQCTEIIMEGEESVVRQP